MTTRRSPEQSTATPKTTPEIQIPSNIALNNLSEDALSTITNREFLRINKEDRLRHITNPSIQSNAVTEGTSVRFRFAF